MSNNFCVGSKGYCFLCLIKISPQFTPVKLDETLTNSSLSVYSLQDLSRYLKFDMRKVFIYEGPVPPQLLAKVEKSRLKVEMCEACGNLADNVSKLCRQLEKLRLEVESGVELIHAKMSEANQAGMSEQFRRAVGSELSTRMGGSMEILEALRMEAMQKCSRNINAASPRLRIQTLTSKEIRKITFRIPEQEEKCSETMTTDPVLQYNIIKTEEPDREDCGIDDHTEHVFAGEFEENVYGSISTVGTVDDEPIQAPVEHTKAMQNMRMETSPAVKTGRRQYLINPKTGKYKCQLCTMEYGSRVGVNFHFSTVHRKVRFKCKICGKEFTQQGTYKRHHQNVHMGIRFQCQVCQRIFSQKDNLMTHQRKGECRVGTSKGST